MELRIKITLDGDQAYKRRDEICTDLRMAISGALMAFKDGGPIGNSRSDQHIDFEIEMEEYYGRSS